MRGDTEKNPTTFPLNQGFVYYTNP